MSAPFHDPLKPRPQSLRLEDHILRVMDNQMRVRAELGECDWNLNMQTESLSFLVNEGHTVLGEVPAQVIGSHEETDNTWQWAWSNPNNLAFPRMLRTVNRMRKIAQETENAPEYFQREGEFPLPFPEFGTAMAIIGAGVDHGFGFYKCPFPGGAAYVAIDRFPAALALPVDPERTLRAISTAIAMLSFDHRAALEAFLKRPDLAGTFALPGTHRRLKVTFTPDEHIETMEIVTPPGARPERTGGFFARLFGRRD